MSCFRSGGLQAGCTLRGQTSDSIQEATEVTLEQSATKACACLTLTCPLFCKYSTSGSALVTAAHILAQLFPFSWTWSWPQSRQFSPVRDVCLWTRQDNRQMNTWWFHSTMLQTHAQQLLDITVRRGNSSLFFFQFILKSAVRPFIVIKTVWKHVQLKFICNIIWGFQQTLTEQSPHWSPLCNNNVGHWDLQMDRCQTSSCLV